MVIMLIPLVSAWVFPHSQTIVAKPYSSVPLCATVYANENTTVQLSCAGKTVGEWNAPARVPVILCANVTTESSTVCRWIAGSSTAYTVIRADYSPIWDAVLAVLAVLLIIRFSVKYAQLLVRKSEN